MVPQNEIYALVRSEEKGEALKEAGFNIRIGDYDDLDSMKEALKGIFLSTLLSLNLNHHNHQYVC